MRCNLFFSRKNIFLVMLSVAIFICTYIFYCIAYTNYITTYDFTSILNVVVVAVYIWALLLWAISGGKILSVYCLFLIYMTFSMAGQTILTFFPYKDYSFDNVYSYSYLSVNKSLLYQILVVPALALGALLATTFSTKKTNLIVHNTSISKAVEIQKFKLNRPILTIYLFLFILLLINACSAVITRMSVGYMEYYYEREVSSFSTIIQYAFILLSTYQLLLNKKSRKIAMICIAILTILYFIAGTRSQAIPLIVLGAVICFNYCDDPHRKKLPWWLVLLIFMGGMLVIGMVTHMRTQSIGQISIFEYFSNGIFTGIGGTISEMGMSAQTLTIVIIQMAGGFQPVMTIFYNFIVAFVPNPVLAMVGITSPGLSLSTWITDTMNSKSGFGSSFMAECYLNFKSAGWIYALVFAFILVWLEKKVKEHVSCGKIIMPCLMMPILCKVVFYARGQFDYLTSSIRFSFILFIIYFLITRSKKNYK